MSLPDACPEPCSECPWRRVAAPGWLGPYGPLDWLRIAHSDTPIACHKTVVISDPLEGTGDWSHPKVRQCRGAAMYRENVMKSPRNPEVVTGPANEDDIFATAEEFHKHHGGDELNPFDVQLPLGTPPLERRFLATESTATDYLRLR